MGSKTIFYIAALVLSIFGVVFAGVAYFAPFENTGVDGTIGALLALIGATATAVGLLLILTIVLSTLWRRALLALIALAAILTAVAAYFLMQCTLAVVMVLALLGIVLALSFGSRRRTA